MSRVGMDMEKWRRKPLYRLMLERLPRKYRKSHILDVPAISDATGYSAEGIYKWWRNGKLSVKSARSIARLSRGKIPFAELHPFIFAP